MVFSQDRVLQRSVEQIIDEDVGMEEIFKVFSQDGVGSPALRGADHGAALRREEAVHLEPGLFQRAP